MASLDLRVMLEQLTTLSRDFQQHVPMLLMYAHIILAALFPIYIGAHAALSRPASAEKPKQEQDDDEEQEEQNQVVESLSASDAITFPITAGIVLGVLYWLIQTYGAALVNSIISWYFIGMGVLSLTKLVHDSIEFGIGLVLPTYYSDKGKIYRLQTKVRQATTLEDDTTSTIRYSPLPGRLGRMQLSSAMSNKLWSLRYLMSKDEYFWEVIMGKSEMGFIRLTLLTWLSGCIAFSAIIYANVVSNPWWFVNIQGFAVSYFALQFMSPTSFIIGSLVLAGLFCYDIWAVFFTPLMVTVATNLDQPIKLVFPRPEDESGRDYSMLGLGDIVLPGLMICLALRFDLFMYYQKKQTNIANNQDSTKAVYTPATGHFGSRFWTSSAQKADLPVILQNAAFPKPYFTAALVGYVAGMIATLAFMTVFQHAQPALLYLVPTVLISLWSTATVRGELRSMWLYSEVISGEAVDDDTKQKEKSAEEGVVDVSWLWWMGIHVYRHEKPAKTTDSTDASIDKPSDTKDEKVVQPLQDKKKSDVLFSVSFKLDRESTKQTQKNKTS